MPYHVIIYHIQLISYSLQEEKPVRLNLQTLPSGNGQIPWPASGQTTYLLTYMD